MSAILFYCARASEIGNVNPVAPRDFHQVRSTLLTYFGPTFRPLVDWGVNPVTLSRLDPEPHHLRQQWWVGVLYGGLAKQIWSMGSVRDQARLACQQAPPLHRLDDAPPGPGLGAQVRR